MSYSQSSTRLFRSWHEIMRLSMSPWGVSIIGLPSCLSVRLLSPLLTALRPLPALSILLFNYSHLSGLNLAIEGKHSDRIGIASGPRISRSSTSGDDSAKTNLISTCSRHLFTSARRQPWPSKTPAFGNVSQKQFTSMTLLRTTSQIQSGLISTHDGGLSSNIRMTSFPGPIQGFVMDLF